MSTSLEPLAVQEPLFELPSNSPPYEVHPHQYHGDAVPVEQHLYYKYLALALLGHASRAAGGSSPAGQRRIRSDDRYGDPEKVASGVRQASKSKMLGARAACLIASGIDPSARDGDLTVEAISIWHDFREKYKGSANGFIRRTYMRKLASTMGRLGIEAPTIGKGNESIRKGRGRPGRR